MQVETRRWISHFESKQGIGYGEFNEKYDVRVNANSWHYGRYGLISGGRATCTQESRSKGCQPTFLRRKITL